MSDFCGLTNDKLHLAQPMTTHLLLVPVGDKTHHHVRKEWTKIENIDDERNDVISTS